jgi:hypothetical protein
MKPTAVICEDIVYSIYDRKDSVLVTNITVWMSPNDRIDYTQSIKVTLANGDVVELNPRSVWGVKWNTEK